MAKNFAEIAFTESVKGQQERYGSQRQYVRLENTIRGIELNENEIGFSPKETVFMWRPVLRSRRSGT